MKATKKSRFFRDRQNVLKVSRSTRLIIWLCFVPIVVEAANPQCFVAIPQSAANPTNPETPLCRAFGELLNSTCGVVVPTCEIRSIPKGSPLSLPSWEAIQLYSADGREDSAGFDLLEKLALRTGLVGSEYVSADRFGGVRGTDAAAAYTKKILAFVRNARSVGAHPRFERTMLKFTGSAEPERVYRLYSGRCRQPRQIATWQIPKPGKSYKQIQTEPVLFRDAVFNLKIPSSADRRPNANAPFNEWAASRHDTLLFGGEPFVIGWETLVKNGLPETFRPYNATVSDGRAGQLQCAFEYRRVGE
jgi:hypothetical protein